VFFTLSADEAHFFFFFFFILCVLMTINEFLVVYDVQGLVPQGSRTQGGLQGLAPQGLLRS